MTHLLVLSLVSLLLSLPLAAANAVSNPGGEEGAPEHATGWTIPKKAGARFSVDGQTAHTGKRSLRVDGLDPEGQDRYVQAWCLTVSLPKEGDLWLTGWAKGAESTGGRVERPAHGQGRQGAAEPGRRVVQRHVRLAAVRPTLGAGAGGGLHPTGHGSAALQGHDLV